MPVITENTLLRLNGMKDTPQFKNSAEPKGFSSRLFEMKDNTVNETCAIGFCQSELHRPEMWYETQDYTIRKPINMIGY